MVFQERTYSVLLVTASDSFTAKIMPLLPVTDYWPVSTARSVGEARRKLTDTEFDIVLINTMNVKFYDREGVIEKYGVPEAAAPAYCCW